MDRRSSGALLLLLAHTSVSALSLSLASRRDALPKARVITQATAIAAIDYSRGDHIFLPGLAAHYRESRDTNRAPQATVLPAFAFTWQYSAFAFTGLAGDGFLRARLQVPFELGLPMQFAATVEAAGEITYAPIELRVDILHSLGVTLGYEPASARARAGLSLGPIEGVSLQSAFRFGAAESTWEIAASYSLAVASLRSTPPTDASQILPQSSFRQNKKREQKVPTFAILVKWGLTPVTALKLTREKNICALDDASRAVLEKHNWKCYGAS